MAGMGRSASSMASSMGHGLEHTLASRMANVYTAVFDVFEKRSFWNVLPTQNVPRIPKYTPLPPRAE